MHRRTALSAFVLASACTLVAACGAATSSTGGGDGGHNPTGAPQTELGQAVSALGAGSALTTTLSLDTTGAKLMAIDQAGGGDSDPLTLAQANLIADARIVVETRAAPGKTLAASQGAGTVVTSVTASSDGTTYFSLRQIDKTLYGQIDLKDLFAVAGQSPEYAALQQKATHWPAFAQAGINGGWVSITAATESALAAFARGASHGQAPTQPQPQLLPLLRKLEATVLSDAAVTRTSQGSTDQLAVSISLRALAADAVSSLRAVVPGQALPISDREINKFVPARSVRFGASVTGGALSGLTFDPGQFDTSHPFTLPIVATFTQSAPDITVPDGVTPVTLAEVISLATSTGDLGGSDSGTIGPLATASASPLTTSP